MEEKKKKNNRYEIDEEDDAELSFILGLGQMDSRAVD